MHRSSNNQVFVLVVLLACLFGPSSGRKDITRPNGDIIGNIKDLLVREGDKLTGAALTKHNASHQTNTTTPLIPSDDIVAQLINLFNCGPFPISPNSHLQYSLDYATKHLRLFQACNRYFRMKEKPESLQVQCKNNKWVFDRINCEETSCPRLTAPPAGHISTNDNIYNTTVYFWCSRGFRINGSENLLCEESGLWNFPPPTCDVSACRPLSSPRHGFVSSQQETATNQTVEFRCEHLYDIVGDAVLLCQDDGRWNNTSPVCKKMCAIPNITSQSEGVRSVPELKSLSIGSLFQQGQRVIFSCKPGYTALLSESSTCIAGQWRPPIHCRKACAPVGVANGKYLLSKNSSTVEYFCLPGYQLVGHQKLSCTSKLTWDSEPPICTTLCTLTKDELVLSFHRKATYESLLFGTQIIHGAQVYFVCQSKPQIEPQFEPRVTTCRNGALIPPPCQTRLVNYLLEIYYKGEWRKICSERYDDACVSFGYKKSPNQNRRSSRPEECYTYDTTEYKDSSKIVLRRDYDSDREREVCSVPE